MIFKVFNIVLRSILYYLNYHFASVKFLFGKKFKQSKVISLLSILPTILFLILHTLLVFLCALYKFLVYIILKLKYGRRFRRFVPGCGVITAFSKIDYGHVNVIVKVQTAKNGEELFEEIAGRITEKLFGSQQKRGLFVLRKQKFGYHFFISTEIMLEEVFTKLKLNKPEISEQEFMQLATKYFNSPLPRNNEFVWDFAFCSDPIMDDSLFDVETTTVAEKTYAFLIRVDHAFSDGISVYNLLSNTFSKPDEAKNDYMKKLTQPNEKIKKMEQKCTTHVVNLHCGGWKSKDLIWSDKTLENGVYLESTQNCLWKIREIRKRFPRISFLNIIYSAYTACMAEFFLKYHADNVPEYILVASPIQMNPARIKRLLTQDSKNDFNNDFSCFLLKCPILIDNNPNIKETIIRRMLELQEQFDNVFNSFDIKGLYVCFRVFMSIFPVFLVSKYMKRMFFGTLLSCVPGGPQVHFFNGARVSNVCYFLPRRHAYGVGIGVLTYADKLQVGFTLDGDKFADEEHKTIVLKGFFKYIDLLYTECGKYCNVESISRL